MHQVGNAMERLLHDNVRLFIFEQRLGDHPRVNAKRAHHARFRVLVLDKRIEPRADVLGFFFQAFLGIGRCQNLNFLLFTS